MPSKRRLGWKIVPLWLEDHGGSIGVSLGAMAIVALFALAWITLAPRYPPQDVIGRITGLGFTEVEGRGSVATASVFVEGNPARIELPSRHGCRVGDTVQLRQFGLRWGHAYRVATTRQPCRRPTPFLQQ